MLDRGRPAEQANRELPPYQRHHGHVSRKQYPTKASSYFALRSPILVLRTMRSPRAMRNDAVLVSDVAHGPNLNDANELGMCLDIHACSAGPFLRVLRWHRTIGRDD